MRELVGFNNVLSLDKSTRCWPWENQLDDKVLAVGELVGNNDGLSVGESDDDVLAVGELVGDDNGYPWENLTTMCWPWENW